MKAVTAEQMRDLDRKAIQDRGVPSIQLMEKAGEGVARAAHRLTAAYPERPIVVVCGGGNNGGDGFVAARMLAQMGRKLSVYLAVPKDKVKGDAAANLARLAEVGTDVTEVETAEPVRQACGQAGLVVDALLGTGTHGELHGIMPRLIEAINACGCPVLAVDIPSGLHADTGKPLGPAVMADETATMGLPKVGLFMYPGADYAGRISVIDIGLPPDLVSESPSVAGLIDPEWVRLLLPWRRRSAHKGDFGRVLVIAGSVGMTGAACLCAQAALRIGAGLVTVACPESLNDILEVKLTEAMTFPLPETYERTLDTRALPLILEIAEGASVLAIGPGISRHPDTALLVQRLVGRVDTPMVIDADALGALSESAGLLEGDHAPTVLTPHAGEMARLFSATSREVQADRVRFTQEAAERFRSVVLLKGAYTLIAEKARQLAINPTGNPGMASGGTGDVLTGAIAGLIAQGLLPFEAACAGAYLHGLAGDLAAAQEEAGVLAGDVVDSLPRAVHHLRMRNNSD